VLAQVAALSARAAAISYGTILNPPFWRLFLPVREN
jgi:hypothetical protein